MLGAAAFVLLAVALCARPLLNEDRTISVGQLVATPESRASAGLMVRYLSHLIAAGGIGLGALWIALSRRNWRWSGLQAGAMVLICAGVLSVPVASDKRLAMNSAIDTILPLVAAAVLYQLLMHRSTWRRALLAGFVAAVAANCWMATAQRYWGYQQARDFYEQNKAMILSQQGLSPDDPQVAAFESAQSVARPMGFLHGANILSSFLLLGLGGTGAALAGCGWWRARRRPIERGHGAEPSVDTQRSRPAAPGARAGRSSDGRGGGGTSAPFAFQPATIAAAGLVLLVTWPVVVLFWIHTAGSIVGLLVAIAVGAAAVRLRNRPKRLTILLGAMLVLLQTGLVLLAMAPSDVHRKLLDYRGAGGDIRNLGARLYYWEGCIRLFAVHPFTGVGPSQFGKNYLAIRPPCSVQKPPDAHDWLLNVAAEWGVLGVLGVLIGVGGSGYQVMRALKQPPDEAICPARAALLPAVMVVLGCWLMLAFDLPPSQWAKVLPYPLGVSLLAAAIVSQCKLQGRIGQLVLLAGLVGFVVNCAAEITPSVPGAMWPFWAMVALVMAWQGAGPASSLPPSLAQRRIAKVGLILAGAIALATVAMKVQPMRAAALMDDAQQAALERRPEKAVEMLEAAAVADPLDPLPLKTAAFLQYRLAQTDAPLAMEHLRNYVALSHAAVQRNVLDDTFWRSLGMAHMFLATSVGDFAMIDEAIQYMRKSLALNPQWPEGWLELAQMAAVTDGVQPDRPALLKAGIEATDRGLASEEGRSGEVAPDLAARNRAALLSLRAQLLRRLEAPAIRPAATLPSP